LLRCNSDKPQKEIQNSGPQILGGYNRPPDPRSNKAGVDSIDCDVEIFGMFEESRLQLCNPHLIVELVVLIIIAFHLWPTVEVIDIEESKMMDA
jgi:hypothetical protein